MDMAHETALNDLIRDVFDFGSARVETRVLLRWFGRTNWGRAIYQGLQQRFEKELADRGDEWDGWQLYVIHDTPYGVMSLICFNPEDTASGKGWWRPITSLV